MEEIKKNSMVHQTFTKIDKQEPSEKISQSGTVYWGEKNLHAQFLNSLYYANPVHGGIIDQKVKFITSGGLSVEGADSSILDNGNSIYNLQEIAESIALDFEISNEWAVLFRKVGLGWIAEPMDFELIRATEDKNYFEYSEDWSKTRQTPKQKYRKIKSIHAINEAEDIECIMVNMVRPKQSMIGKSGREQLTQNFYPKPSYSGAIIPIQAGIQMDWFTYAETKKGFKNSVVIGLNNGMPETPEKGREIIEEMEGDRNDDDNQGGAIYVWADSGENAVTVQKLDGNNLPDRYLNAGKYIDNRTMVAHGVISPSLFAIFTESMFGSAEEMELAYNIFKENYVKARQRNIVAPLTWAFKRLNGFKGKLVFNDYVPFFLKPKEVTPVAPTNTKMSEENETQSVLDMFANVGISRSEANIIHSQSYDFKTSDEDFISSFSLFAELTDKQNKILTMIGDGESYQAIVDALKIDPVELSLELENLKVKGLIDGWKLTKDGSNAKIAKVDFKVLYSYEVKKNVPDAISGSRPFCAKLIELDRLYTRQEIETISGAVGRDVWYYRGGWYHNPSTDKNTPSCRHEWKVNVVSR